MKNQKVRWIGSMVLLLGFVLLFTGCEKEEQMMPATPDNELVSYRDGITPPAGVCTCLATDFALEDLTDEEIAALAFMREEEKMARDVYLTLSEKWGLPIFANIAKAEQRHMDAVLFLIERYDLDDPAGGKDIGEFQNSDLRKLYKNLTKQGAESLEAALAVGATIEDLDLWDLQQAFENANIDNKDILAVFNNLAKGSRNHLRAFAKNLKRLGETYDVQYLSQEDYDAIISSEWERGGGACASCTGNGPGNGTGVCDGSGPGKAKAAGTCDGAGTGGKKTQKNNNQKENSNQKGWGKRRG